MKRNKLYTRRGPSKDGKLYFIFCEGEKRETTYFYFFNRIASQIIIQIVPIEDGKNSPVGLYNNACQSLLKSPENPNPLYELNDDDEIWFIIDTDKWGQEIDKLRENLSCHKNWFAAQSNPCFEVWLYYHFEKDKPKIPVENWKSFLNNLVSGGFNSSKHAMYVQTAIVNAENTFLASANQPVQNTTELFILAKRFLPLVKNEIDYLLSTER